ncbi:cation transport protein-domain-containing protein [Armillaria borealis]|uniref:Potassium transport protein n=1 Tax=Armillaria borealis TaxID=47425 RepID=A0AA39K4T4_9AGAR|nr:cation transport protein-domain-containing protein [Armillaria borealis]
MPSIRSSSLVSDVGWRHIKKHLNFFRIHLLFFAFTPLIFSGIFYASNGRHHISYIDSLFNCVSAMTVCGLATVDLSSLTPWQQVILFIQMCLGSPVLVSWVMVYIRRRYFAKKFQRIIAETNAARVTPIDAEEKHVPWFRRIFTRNKTVAVAEDGSDKASETEGRGNSIRKKLRTDMIRRMDDAPKRVDPNGWISQGSTIPLQRFSTVQSNQDPPRHLSFASPSPERPTQSPRITKGPIMKSSIPAKLARTQTVEFSLPTQPNRRPRTERIQTTDLNADTDLSAGSHRTPLQPHLSIHATTHTHRTNRTPTKHSGFGGFPMPHEILGSLIDWFFPKFKRKLTRTVTEPASTTIASQRGTTLTSARTVPYISFDAVVGHNSSFPYLTSNQLEELGGVEYRALNALLWIVAGYHILIQLTAFIIISPYISMPRWSSAFDDPPLYSSLSPVWYVFSLFQVISAYTNTGMSLVDQSMVPFQQAYLMILVMIFLILAGNTAFVIYDLRCKFPPPYFHSVLTMFRWILTKVVPEHSRANETLHFLLDHPRRCFIYLFPSHQTWFLLTIVLFLNFTDWFFFMVLDIGTPAIEVIPLGTRFAIGLLQAIAVRAAGFGTVTLSALAPAVKVLYVVMMYVSPFSHFLPSVRSTNVYEEQSLGVYRETEESEGESEFEPTGSRVTVWSRYLAMHARKQLAFDMWWLGLALFLVCIIERPELDDVATMSYFNIFTIVFELVSAYGTVGLSLGLPYANYSLSGAFRTLSKLIVCLVMIRGRHRGLPVAIDRAVMFPSEFSYGDGGEDDGEEDHNGGGGAAVGENGGAIAEEKSVNGDAFDLRQRHGSRLDEEDEISLHSLHRPGGANGSANPS